MDTPDITPEQITAWMQAQVAELVKVHPYAAIYINAAQSGSYVADPSWSIYISKELASDSCATFAEALEKINTPKS